MPLQQYEVRTFEMVLLCNCGTEMAHNGSVVSTFPAYYGHTCPDCGHTELHPRLYPYLRPERLGPPLEAE